MAGGSALRSRRTLVLGALALVVAVAIAVSLAVTKPWASTKDRDDVAAPAAGDRVLQSVDVTMQGNGALTRVGDTVVIARAQGGRSDTYSTAYDPTKVVDQLPVRVLTSYQTDRGAGTDLGDLKGYSGRLTINLTVQNLTVRPPRRRRGSWSWPTAWSPRGSPRRRAPPAARALRAPADVSCAGRSRQPRAPVLPS